jgi:hypothetical protein
MILRIKSVTIDDFDAYECVAKNSLGDDHASIRLLRA